MKLAASLLLLAGVAHAAPACFPGDSSADSVIPTFVADSAGCAAVWSCDEGKGAWVRYWIGGTGSECDYGYAKALAVLALTHQQKVDLWNATFPAGSPASTVPAFVMAAPAPITPPASGLTVKEAKVYKLTTPINTALKFSLVGTTKLGTLCDTSLKVGNLYRIDRALVTFPKGVIAPAVTFAKCD
jgi:hypothetical protein